MLPLNLHTESLLEVAGFQIFINENDHMPSATIPVINVLKTMLSTRCDYNYHPLHTLSLLQLLFNDGWSLVSHIHGLAHYEGHLMSHVLVLTCKVLRLNAEVPNLTRDSHTVT